MEIFISIGERLRDVRTAMGLSQTEFAEIAAAAGVPGATRQSQANYEKGRQVPSAAYMAALAAAGVDVLYVLTGQSSSAVLSADERELLAMFRSASLAGKAAAIGALQGVAGASIKKQVTVNAPGGNAAGRDMAINSTKGSSSRE